MCAQRSLVISLKVCYKTQSDSIQHVACTVYFELRRIFFGAFYTFLLLRFALCQCLVIFSQYINIAKAADINNHCHIL